MRVRLLDCQDMLSFCSILSRCSIFRQGDLWQISRPSDGPLAYEGPSPSPSPSPSLNPSPNPSPTRNTRNKDAITSLRMESFFRIDPNQLQYDVRCLSSVRPRPVKVH